MLQVKCPKCQQLLQVGDDAHGKMIRCPKCQQTMMLPAATPAPTPAPPPPPPPKPTASPPPSPKTSPSRPTQEVIDEDELWWARPDARNFYTGEKIAHLADPPQRLLDSKRLGPLEKVFHARRWWLPTVICLALFSGFVVLEVMASQQVDYLREVEEEFPEPGKPPTKLVPAKKAVFPAMYNNHETISVLLFAISLVTLFFLTHTVAGLPMKVELHEKGLTYRGWFRRREYLWSEVERLYTGKAVFWFGAVAFYQIRVQMADGQWARLPSWLLDGREELWQTVRKRVSRSLYPRATAALDRGECLYLGNILFLGLSGLTRGRSLFNRESVLPWEEVGSIHVDVQLFLIGLEPEGLWYKSETALVGNVDLVIRLMEEKVKFPLENRGFTLTATKRPRPKR